MRDPAARTLGDAARRAQQAGELGDGNLVEVVDRGDDVGAQRLVAERLGKPVELVHDTFPGHRPGRAIPRNRTPRG